MGVRRRETGLTLSMSRCSGLMFNYNYSFLSEMQDVENICWIQTVVQVVLHESSLLEESLADLKEEAKVVSWMNVRFGNFQNR